MAAKPGQSLRMGYGGDGIGRSLNRGRHRAIVADDLANLVLDGTLFVGSQRPIQRVVEA